MTQVFNNRENIGDLSKTAATTVQLLASILSIGPRQYKSGNLSCDLSSSGAGGLDTGSLAANTVYYLYTVIDTGSVALVASTSSSSPTGYVNSRIVGAIQVGFDSQILMVTQTNDFNTEWMDDAVTVLGLGSVTGVTTSYRRVNDTMNMQGYFTIGTPAASPCGIVLPASLVPAEVITGSRLGGTWTAGTTASPGMRTILCTSGSTSISNFGASYERAIYPTYQTASQPGTGFQNGDNLGLVAAQIVTFDVTIPIEGWNAKSGLDGRVK